ncbi:MAG: hypothetical protein E6J28_03005 [Chloroflexi bacterium]|nr:MAG: hypothetical protein E6J28_03005 [Chloroflexota bacterium]
MAGPGDPSRKSRTHQRPDIERLTGLLAAAAVALIPLAGAASPSPSPSLDRLIASPPSADFAEDTESSGTPIGAFDLPSYLSFLDPPDPTPVEATLKREGFVAGYGKSWTQQSLNRGLVELVVAFAGGQGARRWLTANEAAAKTDEFYKGAITVNGLGAYYGVHYANPSGKAFADVISFVKGNDFFVVGFVSSADNLGNAAGSQSKLQYDFAAADSIRPADWPENMQSSRSQIDAGKLSADVFVAVLVIGFFVWVLLRIRRNRRGAATAPPQMSPDGRYWWDGQAWREVQPPPS